MKQKSFQMDAPVVLIFHIKYSSNPTIIRSAAVKEYFSKLTTNVEVLYPTQMHNGLLLCKSKRSKTSKVDRTRTNDKPTWIRFT